MLVGEKTLANLEPVPGMAGGGVMPEFNVGLENEGVDANLEVAIRSVWYKILLGILGGILALAVLLKIIGGCYRTSDTDYYNNFDKLEDFFIEQDRRCLQLNSILKSECIYDDTACVAAYAANTAYSGRGKAYKSIVTALYDIRNGGVIPFIKLKDKVAGLFKKGEVVDESNAFEFGGHIFEQTFSLGFD